MSVIFYKKKIQYKKIFERGGRVRIPWDTPLATLPGMRQSILTFYVNLSVYTRFKGKNFNYINIINFNGSLSHRNNSNTVFTMSVIILLQKSRRFWLNFTINERSVYDLEFTIWTIFRKSKLVIKFKAYENSYFHQKTVEPN